jgi:protein-disulfide isomerase
MIARLAVVLALLSFVAPAAAQLSARYPIKADDGAVIANHALSAGQKAQVERLPGLVAVGGPGADVTLYEFYDLNCPYCRAASRDLDALIRADRKLRLVFVAYPVLSVQSIEGARVELAVREIANPQVFLQFHRKVYAGRGIIDGARALAATEELGLDRAKVIEAANRPEVTDIMKAHAQLGSELKLMATPAYVIAGVAIVGHPGLAALRKVVASVRACRKVMC